MAFLNVFSLEIKFDKENGKRLIQQVKKEEKPKIEFKYSSGTKFKDFNVKRRIMSAAAAIAIAIGIVPGVSSLLNKNNENKNETKPSIPIDYDSAVSKANQASNQFFNYEISDEELLEQLTSTGISVSPDYIDIIKDLRGQEPEKKDLVSSANEITNNLINGKINGQEAIDQLEGLGISVDPNYLDNLALATEENEMTDVIYQDNDGNIKVAKVGNDDVFACDQKAENIMLLSPREDGNYDDIINGSLVRLNKDYWNIINVNELISEGNINYSTKDGRRVIEFDDAVQVVKEKSNTSEHTKTL